MFSRIHCTVYIERGWISPVSIFYKLDKRIKKAMFALLIEDKSADKEDLWVELSSKFNIPIAVLGWNLRDYTTELPVFAILRSKYRNSRFPYNSRL